MLCLMTQTQETNIIKDLFPYVLEEETLPTRLGGQRPVRTSRGEERVMELPVNNYLKTPDEIELEFRYGINPAKVNLRKDNLYDVVSIMKTDGYLNIHNLDEALSGFMEENY